MSTARQHFHSASKYSHRLTSTIPQLHLSIPPRSAFFLLFSKMGSNSCCGLLRRKRKPKESQPTKGERDDLPKQKTGSLSANTQSVGHDETTNTKRRPYGSSALLSQNSSYMTARSSAQQDLQFISCDIWAAAYDQLRDDHTLMPLVDNYEEFFDTLLWPKTLSHSEAQPGDSGKWYPDPVVLVSERRANLYLNKT